MALPQQLTIGFILGLLLLSVGHSPDMEIRARAADLLTSIPALSQQPLSFGTDRSGIKRLAQTISWVSLKLKGIAGREAKQ
eukprot:1862554-Rhodomonas_salina.1